MKCGKRKNVVLVIDLCYGTDILLKCFKVIESLQLSTFICTTILFQVKKNVAHHLSNHSVLIFVSLSIICMSISQQTYYCCNSNPAHTTLGIQQVTQTKSESALHNDNDENTTNAEK